MQVLNRFRVQGGAKPHLEVDLFTRKGVMGRVARADVVPSGLPGVCG